MYKVFSPESITTLCWTSLSDARRAFVSPKFRVNLFYTFADLVKEASLMAYTQGQSSVATDDSARAAIHQWFDIEESTNLPILQSTCDMAMTEVESALSAISTGRVLEHRSYDVHLRKRPEYVTEILVSSDTSDTMVQHLSQCIKDYLIDSILAKWSALTNPNVLEYWQSQCSLRIDQIRSASVACQPKHISVRRFPAW